MNPQVRSFRKLILYHSLIINVEVAPSPNVPDFLSSPLGADFPWKLYNTLAPIRDCVIRMSEEEEFIPASIRIFMDSQQPSLDIQLGKAHVVFPAIWTDMKLVLNETSPEDDAFILAHQQDAIPELKKDHQVCFFELCSSASPVFAGRFWELNDEQLTRWNKLKKSQWLGKRVYIWTDFPNESFSDFKKIQGYMSKLVEVVRRNVHRGNGTLRSFWYAEQNPLPEGEKAPRRPRMPWLFYKSHQYHAWEPCFTFFLDEDYHRCRLVEAAIVEEHVQCKTYKDVFREGRNYDVLFERLGPNKSYWKLHVWVNADPMLRPSDAAEAKFKINIASSTCDRDRALVGGTGTCMRSIQADFCILTRTEFDAALDAKRKRITVTLTDDPKSTGLQISAIKAAGQVVTFGDNPDCLGHGFSLQRIILTQGTEVNPNCSDYFQLNVKYVSTVPPDLQDERIKYILKKPALDASQLQAVTMSVFKAVAGVHIVQGPSGNRKTRTTLIMLLILASLEMKVLISAGPDRAVDTLFLSFHRALEGDPKLQD